MAVGLVVWLYCVVCIMVGGGVDGLVIWVGIIWVWIIWVYGGVCYGHEKLIKMLIFGVILK